MFRFKASRFLVGTSLAIGAVVTLALLVGPSSAQVQVSLDDEPEARPEREKKSMKVGTFDSQQVFRAHPEHQKLTEFLSSAQERMHQAQQEEDHQMMQQIHQQYEQAQNRAVQEYQKDIEETLPEVAKAAGVKVVALEIAYKADDVETKDITPQLIREMAEDDDSGLPDIQLFTPQQ